MDEIDIMKFEMDEGLNSDEELAEEAEEEIVVPCKRQGTSISHNRRKYTIKFTEEEMDKILDYIIEHGNYQEPTCQIYYTKLIEHTKIGPFTAAQVYIRMRYLRERFLKTICDSRQSDADPKDIELYISRNCPHYEKLKIIFGEEEDPDKQNQDALYRRPCKKWTNTQIDRILDYIIKHGNFQKPTQQIYYTELVERIKIDAPWNLVKQKIRYLRERYIKAREYSRLSTDDPKAVKLNTLRICPQYEKLHLIFTEEDKNDDDNDSSLKEEGVPNMTKKCWTMQELDRILDYIIQKGDFRKPRNHLYYTELLKKTHIDAHWDAVRIKMRHLRKRFIKARDYSRESNERPDEIESNILRICPQYEKLNVIFGEEDKIDVNENSPEEEEEEFDESDNSLQQISQMKKVWTTQEVDEILDYIITHGEYQKPNCQRYFTKLLKHTNIDAYWDTVRLKMCYLQRRFNKARDYRRLSNDEPHNIELTTLRMCPQYEKLHLIFGKDQYDEDMMENSEYIMNQRTPDVTRVSQETTLECADKWKKRNTKIDGNSMIEQKLEIRRKRYRKEMELEERKLRLREIKMQFEFEIQERKLLLEEQNIKFEQEQNIREFELKKLDMETK